METLALHCGSETLVAGSLVSQYTRLRDSAHLAGRSGWGRRDARGTRRWRRRCPRPFGGQRSSPRAYRDISLRIMDVGHLIWIGVYDQRAHLRLLCRDDGVFRCRSVRRPPQTTQFFGNFIVFKGNLIVSARKNDRYRSPRRRYIQIYTVVSGPMDIAKVLARVRNENC